MTYDCLSRVYDIFTDGFDYNEYLTYIYEKCPELPKRGLALDCGCGTGTLLSILSGMGFDCTGVDESPEMLSAAAEKIPSAHLVCQSLPEIDMYGAYDIVFCSLDTVNHLTEKKDMKKYFRRVFNFTEPGGYLIFDAKTEEAFEAFDCDIAEERENDYLIIKGSYRRNIAEYVVTVFEKNGKSWKRSDADITERFYPDSELEEAVSLAGFKKIKRCRYGARTIWIYKKCQTE